MAVPEKDRLLKGKAKVKTLSLHARKALALSATKSRVTLNSLSKNESGVPLPENGIHWSLSHKIDFVAGVTAPFPVGIDVEKIKPPFSALFNKIADSKEWALGKDDPTLLFYRFWTAKEAVLKAAGKGISGLSRCKINQIPGDSNLIITYGGSKWEVVHFYFGGHMASITTCSFDVVWTLV